ncbi:heme-binding protein [Rhizobium leguminosarum]|uniref:GlcG/HbpS family heme-binding protein n=1 Tax=Rhizobium leguminosarum TaxID=384 RepID=UPI000FF05896|nr:heme-binding protein [Rhizobium leguminosarum]RWY66049.1 heme-binding protein [Rhizobium leguminosarum]
MTVKCFKLATQSLAVLLSGMATPGFAENALYGAPVTVEQARQAAQAAATEMRHRNLAMTIAVVDSGSNLVYLERANQAGIGTVEAAIGKARTANGTKSPTKGVEDAILNGNRINLLGVPGILPIEGGVPLIVDNRIIGAIGASGGPSTDDGAVANAGAKALLP